MFSNVSKTVSGLSRFTFMECNVIVHCPPIQFTINPAFYGSFILDRGPWNSPLHSCLNCSNLDNLSFAFQSNLGLLNCIPDILTTLLYTCKVLQKSDSYNHDKIIKTKVNFLYLVLLPIGLHVKHATVNTNFLKFNLCLLSLV